MAFSYLVNFLEQCYQSEIKKKKFILLLSWFLMRNKKQIDDLFISYLCVFISTDCNPFILRSKY